MRLIWGRTGCLVAGGLLRGLQLSAGNWRFTQRTSGFLREAGGLLRGLAVFCEKRAVLLGNWRFSARNGRFTQKTGGFLKEAGGLLRGLAVSLVKRRFRQETVAFVG